MASNPANRKQALGWLILGWTAVSLGVLLTARGPDHRLCKSGVLLHLALVAVLLCALLGPWLWSNVASPAASARRKLVFSLLLGTAHTALIVYYGLLLIGLNDWGKVISAEMIVVYVRQLSKLMVALHLAPAAAWGLLAGIWLVICAIYLLASESLLAALASVSGFRQRTWGRATTPQRWLLLCVLAGAPIALAALDIYVWQFVGHSDPLLITIFGEARFFGGLGGNGMFDPSNAGRDATAMKSYVPAATRPSKNLIIISVDALRYDQMGVYGFAQDTTPFLSSLYGTGKLTRVDKVYSVCTFSLCGMAAIVNSQYWKQISLPTFNIADVLHLNGYRTSFLMSGDHTHFYGLRKFYGTSIDYYRDGTIEPNVYVNDDNNVIRWLQELPTHRDQPQFIYMHLMSVHQLGMREEQFRRWRPDEEPALEQFGLKKKNFTYFTNNYRNGVLQADAKIGELFRILQERGLLDDCVLVITADHGEYLGEFGREGHGGYPYEPVVRIPLLIYDSEGFTYAGPAVASQIDIAPTLLQRAGIPVPRNWAGIPLSQPSRRTATALDSAEIEGVVLSVNGGLYKYLHRKSGADEWLFDLSHDPGERRNLIDEGNPEFLRMIRTAFASATSVSAD